MDAYLMIAEGIKKKVSGIMMGAVNGSIPKYRTSDGFIRWGLVEEDIHKVIEVELTQDSSEIDETDKVYSSDKPVNTIPWQDPTPEMLETPEFKAVWNCIKTWDINVPEVDGNLYSGATGNHVRAILDALDMFKVKWGRGYE